MTFPADWTTVRVTGKYLLRDGAAASGSVVFSSPQIVRLDDTVILPVDVVAPLDATGAIDVQLPATNDPDVTPAGWAWAVRECIDGAPGRRFAIAVDDAGGDIDLAVVAPIVPPPLLGALSAYNLAIGTVTTLPASAAATAAIRGALPNQVLDLGIPAGDGSAVGGDSIDGTAIAFAFGDASPQTIYTAAGARILARARLAIDTPFDGTGAALTLGLAAAADALMAAADNDPATAASYETAPNLLLGTGDAVQLSITPGAGATQGAGRILLDAYEVTP